jgi:hypothetical protein
VGARWLGALKAVKETTMKTDRRIDSAERTGDDWLDSLIRQDAGAIPYADDAGFTDSVMTRLPARRSRGRYRWIVPVMAVLGFIIGLVVLSGGEALSAHVARLASFESISMRHLLIVTLPLGILYWLGVGAAWQQR